MQMMDVVAEKPPKANILVLGDFNIDLIKPHPAWESTCSPFGLKQLVTLPTRITPTSSTLLDHIYTNNTSKVSYIKLSDVSLSDHCPVVCTSTFKATKRKNNGHTTIHYRCCKNFDSNYFLRLSQADFQCVYSCNNPGEALSRLYDIFVPILLHMPHFEGRERNGPHYQDGSPVTLLKP